MHNGNATATNLHDVQASETEQIPAYLVGAGLCALIAGGFLLGSTDCWHWFIIPVLLCGVVISVDAVDWSRGRLDVFDPAGLLSLFGLHFFFLAPLLQVSNDFWVSDWSPVAFELPDWRPWVGIMATLNLGGLIIYQYVMKYFSRAGEPRIARLELRVDHSAFPVVLAVAVAVAAVTQLWVYHRFGGVIGYITAVEELQSDAFVGWGRLCMISESLPILVVIGFAVYGQNNAFAKSWIVLGFVAVGFLILTLLCSGLRGCRSNTIWTLFWAVGLVHFWIRPVSKKVVCAGIVFLVLFMYGYGFYKWGGREGVASLFDSQSRSNWVDETNRSAMRTLTFDMGRCDVQSFLLYNLVNSDDYEYGYGRSYLGAVALLIPQSIWPDRPPTKQKEGTEALFGRGSYAPGEFEITWIYGLAGEAMLNFGVLSAPLAFAVLGLVTGLTRRLARSLKPGDVRLLFLPLLVSLSFITLAWDSNNLIVFILKNGSIAAIVVLLGTKIHDPSLIDPKRNTREDLLRVGKLDSTPR